MTALPVDVVARIERLELAARAIVDGYLAGRHRSPRHGFAVEFAQHREYSPGDDLRHIDWKVFGRTERHHIKQYEQETNLVAWLLVDASDSMRYGSGDPNKFDTAATLATALTMLITRQSDAVGLATFASGTLNRLKPSSSPAQVKEVLRTLATGTVEGTGNAGAAVDDLAGRLGRRAVVMVFSDFFDDVAPLANALKHLKYQKHDIVVVQVLDAAELDFPFRHPTLFKGLEALPEITADPLSVRGEYLAGLNTHLNELSETCRKLEVDLLRIRTDADLGRELALYLNMRSV
ncbi:DUF58 domain-containing protein [soil metagenome]